MAPLLVIADYGSRESSLKRSILPCQVRSLGQPPGLKSPDSRGAIRAKSLVAISFLLGTKNHSEVLVFLIRRELNTSPLKFISCDDSHSTRR